jgi:hypothetical protein
MEKFLVKNVENYFYCLENVFAFSCENKRKRLVVKKDLFIMSEKTADFCQKISTTFSVLKRF